MYLTDYMFSELYPTLMVEQQTDEIQPQPDIQNAPQQYDPNPVNTIQHPEIGMPQDQFQPPGQDFGGNGDVDAGMIDDGSNGAVEFEDVKKYILYGKLKDLKHKLEMSNIDHNEPAVKNIMEFIDLVTVFYNTFTYEDTVKLFDSLVDSISTELKIKLPSRVDNLEDETPEEIVPDTEIQVPEQPI